MNTRHIVPHKQDIDYILKELRHDYVFGGADRHGRSLEEIMLTTEKNVRTMPEQEVRVYARALGAN
jgi:hypothetical protein